MNTQIQMLIRDLMFINYAVDPDRVRPLVPEELQLDLITGANGNPLALVSVVPFHVADVRSGLLPLPRLSFNQINYRTYVNAGEGAAVHFFDMRVNSRLVTTTTSFLRLPISYEDIEIITAPAPDLAGASGVDESDYDPAPHTLRCAVTSSGPQSLAADITVGDRQESVGPDGRAVSPDFITERPVGYIAVGDSLFKIEVKHPRMNALSSHVESVRAPALVSMGLLNLDETMRPHSVLYVREILMDANVPSPKK
ncbi:MAG TPA: DUF2071 domain-containing protein [Blastocatellia bacterium]|jgi:hypothetical protein|nr:DUF2071 domain-containing protein [Blastocatellia bacterium]